MNTSYEERDQHRTLAVGYAAYTHELTTGHVLIRAEHSGEAPSIVVLDLDTLETIVRAARKARRDARTVAVDGLHRANTPS